MAQREYNDPSYNNAQWEPLSDDAWRAQNDPAGVGDVAAQAGAQHAASAYAASRAAQPDARRSGAAAGYVPAAGPQAGAPAGGQAAQPRDPFGGSAAPEPPAYRPVTDRAASDQTVMRPMAWAGSARSAERARTPAGSTVPGYAATAARQSRGGAFRRSGARGAATSAVPSTASAGGGDGTPPRSRRERAPRAPKPAKHGCLSMFLWLALIVCAGFMALRCLPASLANGRAVPELVSFVPLLFIPLVVCLVLAFLWRRRVLLVFTVAALGLMGWWHAGYFLPTAGVSAAAQTAVATASVDDGAARIMTLNTLAGRASAAEIVQLVREQHVEVLCLQELSDSFASELSAAGIDELLPYHVISDRASGVNNGGRNGIWTLAPMSNISQNLLPIETSSMPAATIQVGSATVRVVSVHPNSPVRGAQDLWEEGLSTIGSLSGYDHTYLIMGDFNSTWDHARFRELLGSAFVDAGAMAGEGFHMTYPSNTVIPPLVEIDHIVYAKDSGIVVSELATATISGTDHQALLATLEAVG